ncbi:MAG TPA: NAD(P)/FAD-dependent oxidoreductase [Roseococcus sp.]|nr:NAD(P)/FAD-dependent oxidoreductase [Roseococcus sp.]
MTNQPDWDVVVIGAGAAGLMCAMRAGQRGRRVLVLDHADAPGKKILISGGGRCNFTNRDIRPERFVSANPHFARSALAGYTAADFTALVERHRIPFHEKTLGQLFCDGSAREVVAMLLAECAAVGVEIRLGHRVTGLGRAERFSIETDRGAFTAESLVLATGGMAIPKMGATGFALDAARRFGLKVTTTRAGLVPLTFAPEEVELMRSLAGVALPVVARSGRTAFPEAMLFTHRGLSGPSILQISSYWREGEEILVSMLPEVEVVESLRQARRHNGRQALHNALAELMPKRLAQKIADLSRAEGNLADLSDKRLQEVAAAVKAWRVKPVGSEGYRTAEVTLGGVDTGELDSRTMEAKRVPGLYFIGEVVDVTGWPGGYNFQWAWSSGWAAGQVA